MPHACARWAATKGTYRLRAAKQIARLRSARLALGLADLPRQLAPHGRHRLQRLKALGVLRASRTPGLRTPEDIFVIVADAIAMAAHANQPLTTIGRPQHPLGQLAMKTLCRRLNGAPPLDESFALVASRLIVRASTGPALAAQTPVLAQNRAAR